MSLDKLKKGDKVILHMFTGIAVNCTEIVACDSKTITIKKKDGTKAKFSRKTGKQVDPKAKAEKFANFITEDDGSYDPDKRTAPKKSSKKKAVKAEGKKSGKKPKAEEDEDDEDEDEEPEEAPKPKKTSKKKTAKKAPKKKVEEEEDEEPDEDDYEEEE